MLQQDFLMRMIQSMVAAFSRLVRMRGDSPEQAKVEIEDLVAETLGTRRELLYAHSLDLLERAEPRVCAQLGRFFALNAEISDELDQPDEARDAFRWSVAAFVRGLSAGENPSSKSAEEAFTTLLRSELARTYSTPGEVRGGYLALFGFAERHHRLPEAEDALFAALDLGAGVELRARALAFFESMKGRGELFYEEHGLSAAEVEEIVSELRVESPSELD